MNGRPPSDDPFGIASPAAGPIPLQTFQADTLELPILIPAALEATGTRVHAFIERLTHGSIWQDQSIRTADGKVDIQAHLAPEGLRCLIRLGAGLWYRHPEMLDVWGMSLPHVDKDEAVPLASILNHSLLDTLPITVRAVTYIDARTPALGICIRVEMPRLKVTFS